MNANSLKLRSWPLAAVTVAYVVMWIGGVGHYALFGGPPLDAPWAASLFLFLAGLLIVLTSPVDDLIRLFAAAALGFIAEVVGVRYGFLFSEYRYTGVLQPQLLDVPLVMLSAWMVLVSYVGQVLMRFELSRALAAAIAAAWMTAIDLVIDPLAANQLGYWRWAESSAYYGIPLHNFAGWLVVSWIIFLAVRLRWKPNPWAVHVGLSIILFFTAIALSYGLWLAGGVGMGLCAIHAVATKRLHRPLAVIILPAFFTH